MGILSTGVLSPVVAAAVAANRSLGPGLGWGCLTGGQVRAMLGLRLVLGLPCAADESEAGLAVAIARWQLREGLPPHGRLDTVSWNHMRELFPGLKPARYAPQEWVVRHRGVVLGSLDKIMPYRRCYLDVDRRVCAGPGNGSVYGGAQIGLGFRVTNRDHVQLAGFERLRWIQVAEFLGHASPGGTLVRKAGYAVEPRSSPINVAFIDAHPYYWLEDIDPESPHHINCHLRRPIPGSMHCYDLLFYDFPNALLAFAQPARRWWANFELALVGVRSGSPASPRTRNEVLTTVRWGYDIVVEKGAPAVRLNRIARGVDGGSASFRRTLSQEIAQGSYPTHCFVGSGWGGSARCA